jgi:hypothetical protein
MIKVNPNLLKYVSLPVMNTEEEFIEFYDKHIGSSPEECLYAIVDKIGTSGKGNSDRNYAGTVALSSTKPGNAATELGIMVSRPFNEHM